MAKKQGNVLLEAKYLGDEPTFKAEEEVSKLNLILAMNWYNATKDAKDAKKYLLASLKDAGVEKVILSAFSKIEDVDCMTTGFLARIVSRGGILSVSDRETFDCAVTGLVAAAEVIAEETVAVAEKVGVVKLTVQDRMRMQADRAIAELESVLDSREFKTNVKEILVNAGVKGPQAAKVKLWVEAKLAEFTEVQKTKDADLKEGYSNYSKADIKAILKWLATVDESLSLVKVARKARKKKDKPVGKVVAAVKYLKSDAELKVTSIDPVEIVGAQQLWVFNVKYRKLGVFVASDPQGLTVKGTTVKNFDEVKSVQKTVRKPEKKIPEVMGAGKVALRKTMDDIKAKAAKLKGRLNGEVLLLKVVK